jgi:hypothetical protein
MKMNLRTFAIATSTVACATLLSFGWSEGSVSLSVETAQARVGRPLTPMSGAGVARRTTRRAVYGTAAVGAAAAAGAYYGYPSYGHGYSCQPGTHYRGEDGRMHLCQ